MRRLFLLWLLCASGCTRLFGDAGTDPTMMARDLGPVEGPAVDLGHGDASKPFTDGSTTPPADLGDSGDDGGTLDGALPHDAATTPCAAGLFACATGCCAATSLSLGLDYSCAVLSSGEARCWGDGTYGRLGTGAAISQSAPVAVSSVANASQIAAGYYDSCAIMNGQLSCWGDNRNGQLGDGTTSAHYQPTVVGLSNVTSIAKGRMRTCAVAGGGAWCWGWSQSVGALGDGTTSDRTQPTSVVGLASGVSTIAGGENHTCVLTPSGTVKCWGYNTGALGNNTTTSSAIPVDVLGLTGANEITAGTTHTCARTGGAVKCWGYNDHGQMGFAPGNNNYQLTAIAVTGLADVTITQLSAGSQHTCALTSAGTIRCWGSNTAGQLGRATIADQQPALDVPSLPAPASFVASGSAHSCAIVSGGKVACWGNNALGQLGDGTNSNHTSPTLVKGSP